MRYMVAMLTGFLEKYDIMILWRFIYLCSKFRTDTINRTVFGKEICKSNLGKWKLFQASLKCIVFVIAARTIRQSAQKL